MTAPWNCSKRARKKAGRTLDDIDRPQLIVCSVDHDHDKAIDYTQDAALPVPGAAAAHRQGLRRIARRWCSRSSPSWAGLPPKSRSTRPSTSCPRAGRQHHRLRHARRSARQSGRNTSSAAAPARSCIRWAGMFTADGYLRSAVNHTPPPTPAPQGAGKKSKTGHLRALSPANDPFLTFLVVDWRPYAENNGQKIPSRRGQG